MKEKYDNGVLFYSYNTVDAADFLSFLDFMLWDTDLFRDDLMIFFLKTNNAVIIKIEMNSWAASSSE